MHKHSARGGEENSSCPSREANLGGPASTLVTILTDLLRLTPNWLRVRRQV
jgi:hypothetical protein